MKAEAVTTDTRSRATARPLGRGDLRLLLLWLLGQAPRHGYELIQQVSEMFVRTYTPSAGSVYPLLADFEKQHWVSVEEEGGRKRYRISALGRAQLAALDAEVQAALLRARHSARTMAKAKLPPPLREAMGQLTRALMLHDRRWRDADVAHITALLAQATARVRHAAQDGGNAG
jgi:DNA-binding PadR family transcriptional regulator